MQTLRAVRDLDAQHEQKIQQVMDACMKATARGDKPEAQRLWVEVVGLIKARSPKQVRRMEQQRGLHD